MGMFDFMQGQDPILALRAGPMNNARGSFGNLMDERELAEALKSPRVRAWMSQLETPAERPDPLTHGSLAPGTVSDAKTMAPVVGARPGMWPGEVQQELDRPKVNPRLLAGFEKAGRPPSPWGPDSVTGEPVIKVSGANWVDDRPKAPPTQPAPAPRQGALDMAGDLTPGQYRVFGQLAPYLTQRASTSEAAAGRLAATQEDVRGRGVRAQLEQGVKLLGVMSQNWRHMEGLKARASAAKTGSDRMRWLHARAQLASRMAGQLRGQLARMHADGSVLAAPELAEQFERQAAAAEAEAQQSWEPFDDAVGGPRGNPRSPQSGGAGAARTPRGMTVEEQVAEQLQQLEQGTQG